MEPIDGMDRDERRSPDSLLGAAWGLGFPTLGRQHCVPSLAILPLVELGYLAPVARLLLLGKGLPNIEGIWHWQEVLG